MKFYILLLAVLVTVIVSETKIVKRDTEDEVEIESNEELADLFGSDENDNNEAEEQEESQEVRNLFKRSDKSYLNAQKHPERLRGCVKCVGIQREKGMNVKQSTAYCNKICKRNLFEDDVQKRFYYWRQRG